MALSEDEELELLELEEAEYQASKSAKPSAAKPEVPMWESGLRGAAQGASLGFADEITGGLEAAFTDKTYEQARDESRKNYKSAEEANPLTYGTGQVGGAIATSVIPGLQGTSLARMAGRGAMEGAAYGLGASEGDGLDLAKDAAVGAGLGAAGGALAKGVTSAIDALPAVGNRIGQFADDAYLNATGATGKQAQEFSPGAAKELRKYVGAFDSQKNISDKLSAAVTGAGKQIDDAMKSAETSGGAVDANKIYAAIQNRIDELSGDPSQAAVVKKLKDSLDNLVDAVGSRNFNPNYSLSEAENIKRGFNKAAGNWADPEAGQAGKELYQTWRRTVEDAMNNVDPAIAQSFKGAKETYGMLAPIRDAAERRASTSNQIQPIGLMDSVASVGSQVAGDPTGLVGMIGRRIAGPRVSSTLAVGADKISDLLKQSPQSFGKYAKPLISAARRGGNALSANHYVLQSTDPEYREQMKKLFGSADEDQQTGD